MTNQQFKNSLLSYIISPLVIKKTMASAIATNRKSRLRPRMSARSLSMIAFIHSLWAPNVLDFGAGDRIPFDIQQFDQFDYANMFPNCDIRNELMNNPFWVKKYQFRFREPDRHGNMVVYLAQLFFANLPAINNRNDYLRVKNRENNWIALSVCENNQITDITANNHALLSDGRVLSARRCGLASVLAYLCFLDSNHLTNRNGYPTDVISDRNWQDGNMPQIAEIGFNNQDCSRIIRIDLPFLSYRNRNDELPGNKAFVYGALAAGFYSMVAYNQQPCARNGPVHCCLGNNRKGNCFLLSHLVDTINFRDPNAPDPIVAANDPNQPAIYLGLDNFMKHYGKIWYFCRLRR